ncbi:MAG: capsule assembly Wzi family protein, partial [Acidobacteriaceae bacterium]
PGLQQLSLRVEGASTDAGPVGSRDVRGAFYYFEGIQKQGPTNNGFLLGDWIGRQAKGGQGWLTYHLSGRSDVQFMYRRAKASIKFFPGGTTQNDFAGSVREWIGHDLEIRGLVQYEGWKAPILTYPVYTNTLHNDTTAEVRITWYPRGHSPQ